jgi:hypothetical protein
VLRQPLVRHGQWQLLECVPAWDGNWTWECFLAFAWQGLGGERLLVTVNYAPNQSQCYVRLPFTDLGHGQWRFEDVLGLAGCVSIGPGTVTRDRPPYPSPPPPRGKGHVLTPVSTRGEGQ